MTHPERTSAQGCACTDQRYAEAFEAMRKALREALADMTRWNNLLDLDPEDQTDLHLPDLNVQDAARAAVALADKVRQCRRISSG